MTVYFADRKMNILECAATGLTAGFLIRKDTRTDEIGAGAASFAFDLGYPPGSRVRAEEITTPGNYLLRGDGEVREFYTIIESELNTDSCTVSVYAEGAGLDLLNEIAVPYEATQAQPAAFYIEKFAYDSGFEIGRNEISDRKRKLKWEGECTVTERLVSVATQFDAELDFSFDIKGMRVLHKYINLYRRRGGDYGVKLRRGHEVGNIVIKKSVANLATALKVTGGVPSDSTDSKPITLNGYAYDDGDFFLEGTFLKSREAVKKWSRYLWESGNYTGHIMRTFSYDTTNQAELCTRAVQALKKQREMQVNYEVELLRMPDSVHIGDTVSIVDSDGALYLTARVLKLESSAADDTHTATLGNFMLQGD